MQPQIYSFDERSLFTTNLTYFLIFIQQIHQFNSVLRNCGLTSDDESEDEDESDDELLEEELLSELELDSFLVFIWNFFVNGGAAAADFPASPVQQEFFTTL